MKTPINFQDYLLLRKDQVANDMFRVLYDDLSHIGQDEVNDEVATEFIKVFHVLFMNIQE